MGYRCANFSLPRPFCSRLWADVCDRQTSDVTGASSLNAPALGAGHNNIIIHEIKKEFLKREAFLCEGVHSNGMTGIPSNPWGFP